MFRKQPVIYTVHIAPARAEPYEHAEFIQEGFNGAAFVFAGVWALYHCLWWQSALLFLVNGVLWSLNRHAHGALEPAIMLFAVHVLTGCYANDIWRAALARRGYIMSDIVAGESRLSAELRFFDRYFAARAERRSL